jgi:hypothetical protein
MQEMHVQKNMKSGYLTNPIPRSNKICKLKIVKMFLIMTYIGFGIMGILPNLISWHTKICKSKEVLQHSIVKVLKSKSRNYRCCTKFNQTSFLIKQNLEIKTYIKSGLQIRVMRYSLGIFKHLLFFD